MNKARVIDNVAVDVVKGDPLEMFHRDIALQFIPVPDYVQSGWRRDPDNGVWSAPEVALFDQQPEMVQTFPKVGPTAFKMLFTPQERIKAKALRATDDGIEDFWSLLDDPRTLEVDLGLPSVQGAVGYILTAVKAAGVDLDVAARQAAIISGVAQ